MPPQASRLHRCEVKPHIIHNPGPARITNIAGAKLTDQELRNAVYSGPWVTDAKRYFSKTGCPAFGLGGDYLKGAVNRQEHLETAIKWISNNEIEDYMGTHQHESEAKKLAQELTCYCHELREHRGIYHMPLPAVCFIVRAIDHDTLTSENKTTKKLQNMYKITNQEEAKQYVKYLHRPIRWCRRISFSR